MAGDVLLNDSGVEVVGNLKADGNVEVVGQLTAKRLRYTMVEPSVLLGRVMPTGKASDLTVYAQNVILEQRAFNPDGSIVTVQAGDDPNLRNYALSHLDGNKLGLNRGGGYTGGTVVEGNVEVTGKLVVGGKDILAALAKLGV